MPRVRQEYNDFDYLNKLNPEEKAWLNKFNDEYLNASFKKDGTDIQDYNKVIGKDEKGEDITYGSDANYRNNHRNIDIHGIFRNKADKANNKKLLNYDLITADVENPLRNGGNPRSLENAYIDFIEVKEIEAMIEEYDLAMLNFRSDE